MTTARTWTVLVVEDHPSIRRMIRDVLEDQSFHVLEAGSGHDALRVARGEANGIDLAIIDLVMPGMGGLDVASSLTAERPGTKVLYISGRVDSVAAQSLISGAPGLILQKPFTPEELVDRVRQVLA